jgi:hypothetical protein
MQKEINLYQEMASEHRLQEYSKGPVPLFLSNTRKKNACIILSSLKLIGNSPQATSKRLKKQKL